MSQYIGKEKAINAVLGEPTDAHYPMWYASILSTLPAVDAVEVVRCKDCYQSAVINDIVYCTYWGKNTDENGYCHEGG